MDGPAILGIRAGLRAGAAVFPAGQRTAEFQSPLGRLRTVMTHFSSRFTDGNAVFTDGEIIFIFYFDAPFHIQVNKGLDVVLTAVNVIGIASWAESRSHLLT